MQETNYTKRVLGLELATDPRWVNLAAMQLQDVLTDHAYCEQKAATACISLIQLYPDYQLLVDKLSPIVTEEWGHFRLVLRELQKRSLSLGWQRKDDYVNALMLFARKNTSREDRLLDKLIVCAMIEARSCERFRLLSIELQEPELQAFYHQLMVAEAGHYKLFLELASHYFGEERALQRWRECIAFETELLPTLPLRGDRIH